MSITDFYYFCQRFIFFHPYISIAIGAGLAILIFLMPKEIIKVLAVFVGILIVIYFLNLLTGAGQTGYMEKEKMIHKNDQMAD
jgi:hypothetical protein